LAGLADAKGNPGDPLDSIDSFFADGTHFRHVELGWYDTWATRVENNIHLTLWQVDERTKAGIPDGRGAAVSFSRKINEQWLPFLRMGYADGSGALLERSVSTGFAYYALHGNGVFGLGLNWGRPNSNTYGTDTRDQYTIEAYYRLQIADRLTITPDIQLIQYPALQSGQDFAWIAGLRARLAF
jgi:porin